MQKRRLESSLLQKKGSEESGFTIVCLIYEYTCVDTESEHFKKRYVGQTMQDFDARHKGHLNQKQSKFDKILKKNPSGFTRSIIEQKTFESKVSTSADEAKVLFDATKWMNEREIYWIAHYDSYKNGLNRTKGGSIGRDLAYFHAFVLDRERAWKLRFKALRAYEAEHGDLFVYRTYRFPKTHPAVELREYKLGHVVNNIRSGHIHVNDKHQLQLSKMCFVWKPYAHSRNTRMKALMAFKRIYGHLMVPGLFKFSPDFHINDLRGLRLGISVQKMRNGAIIVLPEERGKLTRMGFVWKDVKLHRWLLGMREFKRVNGNLLVPYSFKFDEDHHIPEIRAFKLGVAVHRIRSGERKAVMYERRLLDEIGFVWKVKK